VVPNHVLLSIKKGDDISTNISAACPRLSFSKGNEEGAKRGRRREREGTMVDGNDSNMRDQGSSASEASSSSSSSFQAANTGLPVLQQKTYEPVVLPTPEQILAGQFWDSCPVKSVIAGALGGVMGALFGAAFGASDPSATTLAHTGEPLTLRQSVKAAFQPAAMRESMKHLRARSWSYAKGFGGFGMVYSGSECVIESVRAKHDVYNSAAAGCFTGASLAYQGGPKAMCFGCATVAAFSVLIDRFMDIH